FFFQAEDGIRDRNVTGVQTCALPICLEEPDLPGVDGRGLGGGAGPGEGAGGAAATRSGGGARAGFVGCAAGSQAQGECQSSSRRSEERRVGKEGRAVWATNARDRRGK